MMIGNQYKIVSELGSGGMGVVYQAVDVLLEREVAVKKLRSEFSRSPDVAQRFLREAKIQARLNHANITQLYTCLQQSDTFYIVMEFVAGTALNRLIPLPYERLLPLALQMLDSLDYAHNLGVLHRDIKPDNLMVTQGGVLKIMDFGIAHVLGMSRQTREKTIMGTLEYISPERIMGSDPDKRSDIYAIGAVLFEALTGKLPFECNSEFELLRKHIETPAPKLRSFLQEAPEFLEKVIDRALAKDPGERFASCRDMKETLVAEMEKLSIPLATSRGPLIKGDVSEDVDRCRRRITALIKSGDLDLAQRVLDSARADYPKQQAIEGLQALIEEQRRQIATGPGGERRRHTSDILNQLVELEKIEDWAAARQLAAKALEEHPEIKALQIANLHLRRKSKQLIAVAASA